MATSNPFMPASAAAAASDGLVRKTFVLYLAENSRYRWISHLMGHVFTFYYAMYLQDSIDYKNLPQPVKYEELHREVMSTSV
jgi:hypothetical protein